MGLVSGQVQSSNIDCLSVAAVIWDIILLIEIACPRPFILDDKETYKRSSKASQK